MVAIPIVHIHSANEILLCFHSSHWCLSTKTTQSAEMLVPVARCVFLAKFLKKGIVYICNGHSDVSFQELISLAQNFPFGGALILSVLVAVNSGPRQELACNLKEIQYNRFCTDRPACRIQRC